MATLIVNLGTSDLAIKIDNYYIPIGFDRDEPNIDISNLDPNEEAIWEKKSRQIKIIKLCRELGVKVDSKNRFAFRELTKKVFEKYNNKEMETDWHIRIKPDRIFGTIKDACKKFNISKVYFFVTDQPEKILNPKTGEEENNKGYLTDTINLFSILEKWLKLELSDIDIEVIPQVIPQVIPKTISPVDQDALLNHYYQFFLECPDIKRDEEIIVSIKGGTPQMQNALRIQSLAFSAKILFIEPKLSVKRILHGQPSECQLTSYWRYQRNQIYQDVETILETSWDFIGAISILKKWQDLLGFWQENTQESELINDDTELIFIIIKSLEIGSDCLNLDIESAQKIWSDNHTREKLSDDLVDQVERDNRPLNLYTQCRMYDRLEQTANFLSRMSSFYEAVLERLAHNFHCHEDFKSKRNRNRFAKRKVIENVVNYRNNNDEKIAWQDIKNKLESLDYWCDIRNEIIHDARGFSKATMRSLFNDLSKKTDKSEKEEKACNPDFILANMTKILNTQLKIIPNEYHRFIGENSEYYIYSTAKDWVLDKLFNEGLK